MASPVPLLPQDCKRCHVKDAYIYYKIAAAPPKESIFKSRIRPSFITLCSTCYKDGRRTEHIEEAYYRYRNMEGVMDYSRSFYR